MRSRHWDLAVAAETVFTAGGELTGGPLGIGRIPTLPGIDTSEGRDAGYYPLLVGFFAVAWVFARLLVAGPIGFGLRGDPGRSPCGEGRGSERRGVPAAGLHHQPVCWPAMAGALYATWSGYISPDSFRPAQMFFLLTILVVGGMRSLPGLVIATTVLIVAREAFQQFEAYQLIIFGSLVTLVMLVAPDGLAGLAGRAVRWVRKAAQSGTRRPTAPALGTALPTRSGAGLMALLEVRNLKRSFGGIEAVADVSFDVEEGSIHGLIGPNGSGKTTIFNVLSGYYAPSAGEIVFDGRSIGSRPPHEIVAVGIARTFQNLRLFHTLTVRENVQVAAMHAGVAMVAACPRVPGRVAPIGDRRPPAGQTNCCSRVGAAKFADLPIRSLPYGWQRRVELARALACRPRLLMLDEPAAGLNDDETRGLVETVESLRSEGLTILLIEHDMRVVMGTADVVTVLDYGRLVLTGKPNDVATDARVIEAYLGGVPEG